MVIALEDISTMHTRNTLARRLRSLMDSRPDLDTQMKVHARAGISQSSVGRTLSAAAAATVDMLDDLSQAFGVDPAELVERDDTTLAILQRLRKLPAAEKERILGYLDVVLSGALHNPQEVDMAIYRPGTGAVTLVQTKSKRPIRLKPFPPDTDAISITTKRLPVDDPNSLEIGKH